MVPEALVQALQFPLLILLQKVPDDHHASALLRDVLCTDEHPSLPAGDRVDPSVGGLAVRLEKEKLAQVFAGTGLGFVLFEQYHTNSLGSGAAEWRYQPNGNCHFLILRNGLGGIRLLLLLQPHLRSHRHL